MLWFGKRDNRGIVMHLSNSIKYLVVPVPTCHPVKRDYSLRAAAAVLLTILTATFGFFVSTTVLCIYNYVVLLH